VFFQDYSGLLAHVVESREQDVIRRYCRTCPYKSPCEDAYQANLGLGGAPVGIWAGKTTNQRRTQP
jgi:hypothetical protein